MFPIIRNIVGKCHLAFGQTWLRQPGHLLLPTTYILTPSCGFKVKGKVRRRCRDCFMVMREQRMYVLCKTHPRHKQMSMVKDPKNTWILTHATQGKVRPW